MSEMTSGLVERIEAATGPDRELDIAIARLVFNVAADMRPLRDWVKAFTESIDAAITLVPEGMSFDLSGPTRRDVYGDDAGKFVASCGSVPRDGFIVLKMAATPALALCAAALRARAPLPAPPAKDTI